jgi:hypothetical protein
MSNYVRRGGSGCASVLYLFLIRIIRIMELKSQLYQIVNAHFYQFCGPV